jgi:hypothetical protein
MISKREMIFLGGVMAAAIFMLYDRIAPSFKQNKDITTKSITETKAFIQEQENRLLASKLKGHEVLMLEVLQQENPGNPFGRAWIGVIADQKRINRLSSIEPVLSYNGYMKAGNRIVAIVNDEAYETGNKIDHVPLTISQITPTRIDVENLMTESKSRLSVKILPLEMGDEE